MAVHQDRDCMLENPANNLESEAVTKDEDEEASYVSGWKLMVIITSLCLGTLLVAIDNTIIAVAIPEITSAFDSLDDVAWYGSAYLLTVTALQPTFGNIYKYFAVKTSYLSAVVIFEVGSLLCAIARNSPMFILGRAVAGVGAAGLFQGALGIVGYTVPRLKRPLYLGIVVSVFGVASCFGPIVGGVLTSDASWRWCFYINLPVGLPCFVLIAIFLQLHATTNADRRLPLRTKLIHLDLIGALFLIASVCCILLALQWGSTRYPWKSSQVIGLFVGFALLLSAFFFTQLRLGERATIPVRFLRNRVLLSNAFYAFMMYATSYLIGYYLPFYFQAVQDVSARQSGIRFIAFAAPQVAAIVVVGALVTRFKHYVPYMLLSTIVTSIGAVLLSRMGLTTSTVKWVVYLVLSGVGIGIGMQLPFTAVQVISSGSDTLTMNAIISFSSQLGGALTLPIGQTIFVTGIKAAVSAANNDQSPNAVRLPPPAIVIQTGATKLRSLTSDERILHLLREAYSVAVSHVMFLAIAFAATTILCVAFMDWRNMEKAVTATRNNEANAGLAEKGAT